MECELNVDEKAKIKDIFSNSEDNYGLNPHVELLANLVPSLFLTRDFKIDDYGIRTEVGDWNESND